MRRSIGIVVLATAALLAACQAGASTPGVRSPATRSPASGGAASASGSAGTGASPPASPSGSASTPPPDDPSLTGIRTIPEPTGASLVETTYPSPALHMRRNVVVMLPPGYDGNARRYPVVVLLHGDPGSPLALIRLGDLLSTQVAPGVGPFIGVLPDGNGPALQRSWFVNLPSQQMGTSMAVDLRRWVTATFRTDGSYSYAGLSSGGFAAAYAPLLDSQPIHAVCGLSGFYNGDIVPLRGNPAAQQQVSAIAHIQREPAFTFLAYGTSDAETRAQTLGYITALRAAGKHYLLRTYPGAHVWTVWRPGFLQCLRLIVPAS